MVTLIEKIYDEGKIALERRDHPNPLLVELMSVAEHALNYMHTGNTAVIATSIMNALWIREIDCARWIAMSQSKDSVSVIQCADHLLQEEMALG